MDFKFAALGINLFVLLIKALIVYIIFIAKIYKYSDYKVTLYYIIFVNFIICMHNIRPDGLNKCQNRLLYIYKKMTNLLTIKLYFGT